MKKSDEASTRVSDFIAQVRPLDLIVFRGGEGLSTLIMDLEKFETGDGSISHVEVAITREWCEKIKAIKAKTDVHDNPNTLFSWGSTLSGPLNDGVYNAETGGVAFGVQLRVLEDVVTNYLKNTRANVGLCRLIDNPTLQRADESDIKYQLRAVALKHKIAEAYETFNGRLYDANILALLASLFPSLRPLRNATEEVASTSVKSWLFCSEFAAVLYEFIDVIGPSNGKEPNPENVVPVDFLGSDTDIDGIVKPICEIPPTWIKPN